MVCENIKDFSSISKLGNLEELYVARTNISDVTFLENNKFLKQFYIYDCKNISKNEIKIKNEDLRII